MGAMLRTPSRRRRCFPTLWLTPHRSTICFREARFSHAHTTRRHANFRSLKHGPSEAATTPVALRFRRASKFCADALRAEPARAAEGLAALVSLTQPQAHPSRRGHHAVAGGAADRDAALAAAKAALRACVRDAGIPEATAGAPLPPCPPVNAHLLRSAFPHHRILGDGRCVFRSLASGVSVPPTSETHAADTLRTGICEYHAAVAAVDPAYGDHLRGDYSTLFAYLSALRRPTFHGGADDLHPCAEAAQTEVVYVDSETFRVIHVFSPPELFLHVHSSCRFAQVYSGVLTFSFMQIWAVQRRILFRR